MVFHYIGVIRVAGLFVFHVNDVELSEQSLNKLT
jgi:hypothetical protein